MSEQQQWDDGLGDLAPVDGPWSAQDAPAEAKFLDFGPLKVPQAAGLKARVEFDRKTRKVGAVAVQVADCDVQLQVIAAPRGQGVWADVRRQIHTKLRKRPGTQQAMEGRFGPELIATLTGRRSDGMLADTTMRIIGIEGDRWLLRAVVTGPSVTKDSVTERVNAFLTHCAVHRGDEAVGAGTVLELTPPPGALAKDELQAT